MHNWAEFGDLTEYNMSIIILFFLLYYLNCENKN